MGAILEYLVEYYLYILIFSLFLLWAFLSFMGSKQRKKNLSNISLIFENWDYALMECSEEEKNLLEDWDSLRDKKTIHNDKILHYISEIDKELDEHKKQEKSVVLKFKEEIFNNLYCDKSRLIKYKVYDAKLIYLESILKKIKQYLISSHETHSAKHAHYYEIDIKYRSLCLSNNKWLKAHSRYKDVLSAISRAKSEISEAETMETVDLFTDNKAISFMSTMSTGDASNAINAIKPKLEALEKSLKDVDLKKMKDLPEVDDSFDLMMDFFFDFDFFSILNLFALSDANNKVSKVREKIKPLGNKINVCLKMSEQQKINYLNRLS